jgi:hypothetical protein
MNIRNNTTRKMAKSHQTSSATIDGCELKTSDITEFGENTEGGKTSPTPSQTTTTTVTKHRKKREELSSSATKSIKKEFVDIVITFD